jgi:hypothetical protein
MYSVCILIYIAMYLYSYLSTHGISGVAAGGARQKSKVRLKMTIEWAQAVIKWVWRCNWRSILSKLRDSLGGYDWVILGIYQETEIVLLRHALGDHDRASLEMLLETKVEWTEKCRWRPRTSEVEDAIGDRDWVNSEMHLEAVIEWVKRCTGSLWSSEFADALWGHHRVSVEMQLETGIEWTQRYTLPPW